MPEAESWSIGRLLTWTTDYLRRHGADSPRLDAEVLLAHARHCERIELYTAFDQEVSDDVRLAFRELVRRRAAGTPVAYLVGYREFYSLPFRVTGAVLIPRPETELVVMTLLGWLKPREASGTPSDLLDVGTGSGAIAISVARHTTHCNITAVDISPTALEVARGNARELGVDSRINWLQSDLLDALPAEPQFDFIASNPPYVSRAEWEQLAPEVRDHEPQEALVAGPTGTEVIARLIPQAAQRLRPEGSLIMEISPMIHEPVEKRIASDGRFGPTSIVKDLAGLPRVIHAQRQTTSP